MCLTLVYPRVVYAAEQCQDYFEILTLFEEFSRLATSVYLLSWGVLSRFKLRPRKIFMNEKYLASQPTQIHSGTCYCVTGTFNENLGCRQLHSNFLHNLKYIASGLAVHFSLQNIAAVSCNILIQFVT